jgi:hypothetical protein
MKYNLIINDKSSGKFKRIKIEGRSHLVTQFMAIRGDTSMNGIFYSDDDLTASFMQLDLMPAPNGHPILNGVDSSAYHPVAVNMFNIGGFIKDPRKKGKRVFVDYYLDEDIASRTPDGIETTRRITSGERLSVSTGLTFDSVIQKTGVDDFGVSYDRQGKGFNFDHVATLLYIKPAGEHAGTEMVINAESGKEFYFNNEDLPEEPAAAAEHEKQILTNEKNEVYTMDKKKLAMAIIANSSNGYTIKDVQKLEDMSDESLLGIVSTDNISEDSAKSFLTTNSKVDFAAVEEFQTNKAEFDLYMKEKADKKQAAIDNIKTNSEYTQELLVNKSMQELELITNMLKPTKRAVQIPDQSGLATNSQQETKHKVNFD